MKLKDILKARNKTKQELADYVGVSTNAIRNYEKGINSPTLNVVIKMAEFLDVALETITGTNSDIVDLKMLNVNKRKLIKDILNLDSEDVDKVSSFIAGLNAKNKI